MVATGPVAQMRGATDADECYKSTGDCGSCETRVPDASDRIKPDPTFGNPQAWDMSGLDRTHLVWCNEHIHKPQFDAQRIAVSTAMAQAGASLLCLKKGAQFSTWAAAACRAPFVLLTNWREAKPCMAAAQQYPWSYPVFTVVICEQHVQYMRARAWLENDPRLAQHVQVVDDSACPRLLVLEMLSRLSRNGLPQVQHATQQPSSPTFASYFPLSIPSEPQVQRCQPEGMCHVLPYNRTTLVTEPRPLKLPLVSSPADLLRCMFASASADEVEQMLRNTMLDTYRE
mmetsp:Transcript_131831/g.263085  ORF Transcript_131831/g.263085 Transcript_131831/m.263085 type:complete len:286 (+) Transcript_131831:57-914(+)